MTKLFVRTKRPSHSCVLSGFTFLISSTKREWNTRASSNAARETSRVQQSNCHLRKTQTNSEHKNSSQHLNLMTSYILRAFARNLGWYMHASRFLSTKNLSHLYHTSRVKYNFNELHLSFHFCPSLLTAACLTAVRRPNHLDYIPIFFNFLRNGIFSICIWETLKFENS